MRDGLCPSNEKLTSSIPKLSAQAPNASSAPRAPPLKRITSSRRTLVLVVAAVAARVRLIIDRRIFMLHEVRRDVDGIVLVGVVEIKRAARELGRNRAARLLFVLLERLL